MRRFVVALCADARYFPPAAWGADRLFTLNRRDDVEIVVFSNSADDTALARQHGLGFSTRLVDEEALSSSIPRLPGDRLSNAAYYRIFLPELVDDAVERVLYLDSDVYVESDEIFSLFDLDMQGMAVAAARDIEMVFSTSDIARREMKLALCQQSRRYLNSGLLLLDVPACRRQRLTETIMKVAGARGLHDQAAINRVLRGDWLELSPRYNATPITRESFVAERCGPIVMTHFFWDPKPWHGPKFRFNHPARKSVEDFLATTPWWPFIARQIDPAAALAEAREGRKVLTPRFAPEVDIAAMRKWLGETEFADMRRPG